MRSLVLFSVAMMAVSSVGHAAKAAQTVNAMSPVAKVTEVKQSTAETKPAPAKSSFKSKSSFKNDRAAAAPKAHVSGDWKLSFEQAKRLLVADQKYQIQFEDEENLGRIASPEPATASARFSTDDVRNFRQAVEGIVDYRAQLKQRCSGTSTQGLIDALNRYGLALASAHTRALPIASDISQSNGALIIVVNRTALRDAPILLGRYFQAKKQRYYMDGIEQFAPADGELVNNMYTIAKTLHVDITDEDKAKSYELRDDNIEMASVWPRKPILAAAKSLGEAKEPVCSVTLSRTPQQIAE